MINQNSENYNYFSDELKQIRSYGGGRREWELDKKLIT